MHKGIELMESILTNNTLEDLKTLADLKEENIVVGDNGFKFTFERSLQTNYCNVVRYHDKIIVEFRKRSSNLIEGEYDQLVFEDVIKPQQFRDVFERVTGIYISYLDK